MLRIVLPWIMAALCLPVWAQVRVTGRVTNQTNVPVAGARITLRDVPPTATWEAISDATGFFVLQVPAAGEYSIRVNHDGFYVVTQSGISIPAGVAGSPPPDLAPG